MLELLSLYDIQEFSSLYDNLQDMLVSLSTLLRGTTYEKLRWTFTLYDLNKDGYITKQEVTNVVLAVHELMGIHGSPQVHLDLTLFLFYRTLLIFNHNL